MEAVAYRNLPWFSPNSPQQRFPPPHTHKPLLIVWVCSSPACVTLPYWCIRAISVHAHSYLRTHHPLTRFPIYRGKFVKAQWRFHDQLSLNVLSTEISCLTLAQLCFLSPRLGQTSVFCPSEHTRHSTVVTCCWQMCHVKHGCSELWEHQHENHHLSLFHIESPNKLCFPINVFGYIWLFS